MNTTKLNQLATMLERKAESLRQIEYNIEDYKNEIESLKFEELDTDKLIIQLEMLEKYEKPMLIKQIKTIIKKLNDLT